MPNFVDLYKLLEEEKALFHTKLEKFRFEDGRLYLKMSPLARRFLMEGDLVSLGYAGLFVPGRVVGKDEHIVVKILYTKEKKLGDRTKPRVPIPKDQSFFILLRVEGVFRAFEPFDISEGGFSIITSDNSLVTSLISKEVEFRITGREELSGVAGTAKLVGILEKPEFLRLAFEIDIDDASATRIRFYAIKTMWRLLSED